MRLTEDERVGIVGAMQERRQKLIDETNRMSVSNKTCLFATPLKIHQVTKKKILMCFGLVLVFKTQEFVLSPVGAI